jgi:guanine deaminase
MDSDFMKVAIGEALIATESGDGGPFGAVIVLRGKIIAKAHNEVLKTNDPTAHAEMLAIRRASKKLKKFRLAGCELYTSAEPCPMCLGAIYWAGIKKVFFGCTKHDTARIGFRDEGIYKVFAKSVKRKVCERNVCHEECLALFDYYKGKKNKKRY